MNPTVRDWTLRAVSPRSWIEQTNDPDLKFRPSLRAFTTQRAGLLAILEPLPEQLVTVGHRHQGRVAARTERAVLRGSAGPP
jgi:hypothetical protein